MPEEPALINPPRSRRVYVLWTIALTLLISAGLLCWLVVVPVMQVRRELTEKVTIVVSVLRSSNPSATRSFLSDPSASIERLGGPQKATRKIEMYLRMPGNIAPDKSWAILLLGSCGQPSIPVLIRELGSPSVIRRGQAARQLGRIGPGARSAIPALRKLLEELKTNKNVWTYEGQTSLGNPASVSEEAAEALRKIQVTQEQKQ
jgi:PBS lyase HEAT-like repeat